MVGTNSTKFAPAAGGPARSSSGRSVEKPAHVIRNGALFGEGFAARLQLPLDDSEPRENAVPLALQPANVFIRKFADAADRDAALKDVHRAPGQLAEQPENAENVFGFLQQICPDLSELAFLFGRNNRTRLVQTVGNQVVQLFPIIQLERH